MADKKVGKYILGKPLGEGAMGMVYKALDPVFERHVAVKLMLGGRDQDEEAKTRFFREARSAGQLNHPNIVIVYDMGEDAGTPFIVMELVEGQDLKVILKEQQPVAFDRKLDLIIDVLGGLQAAHEHGIVHRDVKPSNIRVTPQLRAKLMDFGIARIESSDLTRTGQVVGTPHYMSPEQINADRRPDGKSDVFSVGVILYELVAGRRPFEGATLSTILFSIAQKPHPPLRTLIPDCAVELDRLVSRALAKNPDERPTAGEMAEALRDFKPRLPALAAALQLKVREMEAALRQGGGRPEALEIPNGDPDDYGNLLLYQGQLHAALQRAGLDRPDPRRKNELFERVQALYSQGEYSTCLSTVEELLKIDPGDASAHRLRDSCRQALEERRRRIDELVQGAEASFQGGDWTGCQRDAARGLALDPANTRLRELNERAQARAQERRKGDFDKRDRIANLLKTARHHLERGHPGDAVTVAESILRELPEHAEALELRTQARTALDEIEQRQVRSRTIQKHLEEAEEGMATEVWQKVAQSAESILKLEEKHARAQELREKAMRQLQDSRARGDRERRSGALRAEIESLRASADHAGLAARAEELLKVDPDDTVGLDARETARRNLAAAREAGEKAARERSLLEEGRARLAAQDLDAALRAAEAVLVEAPQQAAALDLKRQALEAQRARRDRREREKKKEAPRPGAPGSSMSHVSAGAAAAPAMAAGDGTIERDARRPGARPGAARKVLIAAAALAVLIGLGLVGRALLAPKGAGGGGVALMVAPWGRVDSVRRARDGAEVAPGALLTPCRLELEPGGHHITLSHPDFGRLELDVLVEAGRTVEVNQRFPGFEAEAEIRALLEARP